MPMRAPKGYIDETDPKVCQVGHPAPPWLVNYADLMTEMVCFFVILYALSAALNKNVQNAAQQVKEMMEKGELPKNTEVKVDKDGLKISLEEQKEKAFFESGNADLTPDMEGMIGKLSPVLKKLAEKQDIIVEGHTDNVPIHNQYYDSNWELSTSRATSVARLLIDKYGLPPEHMGAIGYGSFRPIVANDSLEHHAKNRRVVFFVKNAPFEPKPTIGPAAGAHAGGAAPPPPASGEQPSPAGTAAPGLPTAAPEQPATAGASSQAPEPTPAQPSPGGGNQ